MTTLLSIALLIGAYLLGSIPSAYLFARWRKGIDIRRYGSGTVSGSMIWEHVSKPGIVLVGVFDVCKAVAATWLGYQISLPMAVAAGLMAAIGHNWPIFLRFIGGRGLGLFLGMCLVLFPWGCVWILASLILGRVISRDSAPWAMAAMLGFPLFVLWMGQPAAFVWGSVGMLCLTIAKRLEGNQRHLPDNRAERRRVLLYRVFLDRDIRSWEEWVHRTPATTQT